MGRRTIGVPNNSLPEGVEVRQGKRGASIRICFMWRGRRRRQTLAIEPTTANIRYASRKRAEILNAIERGTFDAETFFPRGRKELQLNQSPQHLMTVGERLEEYINELRQAGALSPASVATYHKWARRRIKPDIGHVALRQLTSHTLRQWVVRLNEELSPKSVRNCVSIVSCMLAQCVEDGVLLDNPMRTVRLKSLIPRATRQTEKFDPFNRAEIAAILSACTTIEERALFQFAFASGLRTGELIALKWKHVDWQKMEVLVEDNLVMGEGVTILKQTKTHRGRVVPILKSAEQALKLLWRSDCQMEQAVFTFNGKRWRDSHHIRRRWQLIIKQAGVRYRRPYVTRHTFASTLLMCGEPEVLVAKLLGHTTLQMVQRHYGAYVMGPNGMLLKSDYQEDFGS